MMSMMPPSLALAIVGTVLVVVAGGYKLEVIWPSGEGGVILTPSSNVQLHEK